jgi:hypothetical protein
LVKRIKINSFSQNPNLEIDWDFFWNSILLSNNFHYFAPK